MVTSSIRRIHPGVSPNRKRRLSPRDSRASSTNMHVDVRILSLQPAHLQLLQGVSRDGVICSQGFRVAQSIGLVSLLGHELQLQQRGVGALRMVVQQVAVGALLHNGSAFHHCNTRNRVTGILELMTSRVSRTWPCPSIGWHASQPTHMLGCWRPRSQLAAVAAAQCFSPSAALEGASRLSCNPSTGISTTSAWGRELFWEVGQHQVQLDSRS